MVQTSFVIDITQLQELIKFMLIIFSLLNLFNFGLVRIDNIKMKLVGIKMSVSKLIQQNNQTNKDFIVNTVCIVQ